MRWYYLECESVSVWGGSLGVVGWETGLVDEVIIGRDSDLAEDAFARW